MTAAPIADAVLEIQSVTTKQGLGGPGQVSQVAGRCPVHRKGFWFNP